MEMLALCPKTTTVILAVIAIVIVVGSFVAMWYEEGKKDNKSNQ